jgi:hypothetical protein
MRRLTLLIVGIVIRRSYAPSLGSLFLNSALGLSARLAMNPSGLRTRRRFWD